MMTPTAVKWIKVSHDNPHSGSLQPVLCFRGETEMVGLVASAPVRVIKRPAKVFDSAPPVYDRRVAPASDSDDLPPTAPRGMLAYLNAYADFGITDGAQRLLRWATLGGFDGPVGINTAEYENEEPT